MMELGMCHYPNPNPLHLLSLYPSSRRRPNTIYKLLPTDLSILHILKAFKNSLQTPRSHSRRSLDLALCKQTLRQRPPLLPKLEVLRFRLDFVSEESELLAIDRVSDREGSLDIVAGELYGQ